MDPHYYEDISGGCTWALLPPKVVFIRHETQADEEIVAWVKQHTNLIACPPLSVFLRLLYIPSAYYCPFFFVLAQTLWGHARCSRAT